MLVQLFDPRWRITHLHQRRNFAWEQLGPMTFFDDSCRSPVGIIKPVLAPPRRLGVRVDNHTIVGDLVPIDRSRPPSRVGSDTDRSGIKPKTAATGRDDELDRPMVEHFNSDHIPADLEKTGKVADVIKPPVGRTFHVIPPVIGGPRARQVCR